MAPHGGDLAGRGLETHLLEQALVFLDEGRVLAIFAALVAAVFAAVAATIVGVLAVTHFPASATFASALHGTHSFR